jgi:hypothetical protein
VGLRGPRPSAFAQRMPWRPRANPWESRAEPPAVANRERADLGLISTDRVRKHRARRRAGKVSLSIEADEVALLEFLAQARLLDPLQDHDRDALARAVERLLALMTAEGNVFQQHMV